jgi:hypothetical protein
MATTCLDTLVGLSNRECSCYDTGRPVNWNTSTLGYYLTDREYGFPIKAAVFANIDCGQSNVWDELEEARTQAIRDVKNDIQAGLNHVRKKKLSAWKGRICTIETEEDDTYNSIRSDVLGLQVVPRKQRYASFIVKAIWLYLDTGASVDVSISSNDTSFSGSTETITAVAGTPVRHTPASEIELPFYSDYRDLIKYNFSYSRGSMKPLWNKVQSPYCAHHKWWQHMGVFGFALDALDNDFDADSNDAYGLALEGYFKTYPLDWICDLDEKGGDDFFEMIARLIQLKGAIKLMSIVLENGNVNYYTIIKQEQLFGRIKRFAKLYEQILMQLINNVPASILEVYGAKKNDPNVNSIIV